MKATDLVASERAWRDWKTPRAPWPHDQAATSFGDPEWQRKQRELVRRAMSRGLISVSAPLLSPQAPAERLPAANAARKNPARPGKKPRLFQNRSL